MHSEKSPYTLNLHGRLYTIREPLVMGVINATPDSFYSGSRISPAYMASRAEQMLQEGASIIDIGGCSTRPGAAEIGVEEEWNRLAKPVEAIRKKLPDAILSVDTFRSEVARRCVKEFEVDIINDVSGGTIDSNMFHTIAELHVPYVLMHSRGTASTMQSRCNYRDVTADVLSDLAFKDAELRRLGVSDVIIDPGFGFAKTTAQNYALLDNLEMFKMIGRPLLVGISRKSMISRVLGCTPAEALNGTTVINTVALMKGASILRVHDVKEAVETVKLVGHVFDNSQLIDIK